MSALPSTGFWSHPDPYSALCAVRLPLGLLKADTVAGVFLHGVCGIFALTLAEWYGYPIYIAYEPEEAGGL